jgi:hypothetical protein
MFVAIANHDPVALRPETVEEEERNAWKTRMIEQMQQQLTVDIREREEALHGREMVLANIEAERAAERDYIETLERNRSEETSEEAEKRWAENPPNEDERRYQFVRTAQEIWQSEILIEYHQSETDYNTTARWAHRLLVQFIHGLEEEDRLKNVSLLAAAPKTFTREGFTMFKHQKLREDIVGKRIRDRTTIEEVMVQLNNIGATVGKGPFESPLEYGLGQTKSAK